MGPADASVADGPARAAGDLDEAPTSMQVGPAAPPAASSGAVPPASSATSGWSVPATTGASVTGFTVGSSLPDGFVLGDRYRIERMLGEGGMGSVYVAADLELERPVALKIIRPDLARHPAVLQRFKQEIILAREVTHRNVVRIFDLGSAQGLKFITMELVEGRDLKELINDGHEFSFDEVVRIIVAVCRALQAAHDAGIVHRDLKPQNIMIDAAGEARVMDFGIARSMELTGLTHTGDLLGTPAYMSPEQAQGLPVDTRSDIFSLGIIFYELLVGSLPFEGDSTMAMLLARTREKATPPVRLRPEVPPQLSAVVERCLETEPDLRYQTVNEVLADLETGTGPRSHTIVRRVPFALRRMSRASRWAVALALLAAVASATMLVLEPPSAGTAAAPAAAAVDPLSLLIVPFRNASGDADLDWLGTSLPDLLRTDVGQSARLRTVSPERVQQILDDLRVNPATGLDGATVERISGFTSARLVLSGQYVQAGELLRFDATLRDLETGSSTSLSATSAGGENLLRAVGDLAAAVRSSLDLSADAVRELEAASFMPSTDSVEALRAFNEGLQLSRVGNYAEALGRFEEATAEDPAFGLAHSKLAESYLSLGRDVEAARASRSAVELAAGLPDYERLLIEAQHSRILGDTDAAIAAYERILESVPEDLDVAFDLAALLEATGSFDTARQRLQDVLRFDPQYVEALYLLGRVEVRSGRPEEAVEPFNDALNLSIQLGNAEGQGRILNAMGIAYRRMGRPDDAVRNFEQALEINRRLDQKAGIAANLSEIGRLEQGLGDLDGAGARFDEALTLAREVGSRDAIGGTLIDLGNLYLDWGRDEDALQAYRESLAIWRELGSALDEALCLNNIGAVYMDRGQYGDALTYLEQALQIRQDQASPAELGETLHNLGETTTALGRFDGALEHYLRALEQWRQVDDALGIAAASSGIGVISGYQGRLDASLQSAAQAHETLGSDEGYWGVVIGVGYGRALGQVGRFDEADAVLAAAADEADAMDNDALRAQVLVARGEIDVFRGDHAAARGRFAEAVQRAGAAGDRALELTATLDASRLPGEAVDADALAGLTREAEGLGLRYLAAEAQILHAEALMAEGRHDDARGALEAVLNTAERLQLRLLMARSYQLLGEIDRTTGDEAAAARRLQRAAALLDEIAELAGDHDPFATRGDLRDLRARVTASGDPGVSPRSRPGPR